MNRNLKEEDIKVLTIVRKVLVDACMHVYRDSDFFFSAENKKLRRTIYERKMKLKNDNTYSIVCKTFCEMIKEYLVLNYSFDVEVIKCDNDEFSHCDIIVNINGNKYIINCLSDLERVQFGMSSKRFASLKYCEERYPLLCETDNICYLTFDEVQQIDKEIGYYNGMYFDEVIKCLKNEFDNFKLHLINDDGFRYNLIGNCDINKIKKYDILDILKLKVLFLCRFFNERQGIIGHIELIRIYKLLIKKLFNKEEMKILKFENCFFDCSFNKIKNLDIFNTNNKRIRFISIQAVDYVFLISIVNNKYILMNKNEWEYFKTYYNVYSNILINSNDSISEVLRNKGIGVNIMKHSIVKNKLLKLDSLFLDNKSEEEIKNILDYVRSQDNMITLNGDNGISYNINLFDNKIEFIENEKKITYYFLDDNLVEEFDSNYNESIIYVWKDEGIYEKCKIRKDKVRKKSL